MADRKFVIETKVTGSNKTLKTIKDIDDALKQVAADANNVGNSFNDLKISKELLNTLKELNSKIGTLGKSTAQTTETFATLGDKGKANFDKINKGVLGTGVSVGQLSNALNYAGKALDLLSVPVNIAIGVETSIAKIRTVSDVSEQTLNDIKKLGTEVPQTMVDVTGAAYDALSAQISEKDLLPLLKASSDLAVLGLSDLTTATNSMIVAQSAFAKEGINSAAASDIFFETVRRGRLTLKELASAFPRAASTAAALGVSMEETGAIFAALTKKGNSAAESAVQLNAVMKAIAKPTKDASDLFNSLGIEYGVAALKSKGVIGVLDDIRIKTGGSSQALTTLFGNIRQFKGVAALLSDNLVTVRDDFDKISNSAGVVERNLDKVKVTTQATINSFNALKEGVLNEIGENFLPIIKNGLDTLSSWIKNDLPFFVEGIKEIGKYLDIASLGMISLVKATIDLTKAEDDLRVVGQNRINAAQKSGKAIRDNIASEVASVKTLVDKQYDAAKGFAQQSKYIDAWKLSHAVADKKIAELTEKKLKAEKELAEIIPKTREGYKTSSEAERLGLEATRRQLVLNIKEYDNSIDSVKKIKVLNDEKIKSSKVEIKETLDVLNAKLVAEEKQALLIADVGKREVAVKKAQLESKIALAKANLGAEHSVVISMEQSKNKILEDIEKKHQARKKSLQNAKSNAQRTAQEQKNILLIAQEEELKLIADKDIREVALLRLKQGRLLEERIKLMGVEHQSVKNLILLQQMELEEIEKRQFKRLKDIDDKRNKENIKNALSNKNQGALWKWRTNAIKESTKAAQEQLAVQNLLQTQLKTTAEGMLNAGVTALFYGNSIKDAINDVLEGIAIESTVRALFETAAGISALIFSPPQAGIHFKSAAVFGATAVAAGAATLATGGFNGATGASSSNSTDKYNNEPKQNPNNSVNNQPTTIIVNFSGQPLHTKNDIGKAIAESLDNYSRSRGKTRFDSEKYRR